ncbi:MAG: hypothetical protein JWO59_2594 [Chloroflexi bacterium]|nr:hypothetical protein [Chloroflexota bacterium]
MTRRLLHLSVNWRTCACCIGHAAWMCSFQVTFCFLLDMCATRLLYWLLIAAGVDLPRAFGVAGWYRAN